MSADPAFGSAHPGESRDPACSPELSEVDPGFRRDERGIKSSAIIAAYIRNHAACALDLLLPPACRITGERVAMPGTLSAAGWAALSFIDDPVCARCGYPFERDHGAGGMRQVHGGAAVLRLCARGRRL